MLELGGLDWSRHTASTISVTPALGRTPGVFCFWIFALLALAGAFTRPRGGRRCSSG